MEREHHLRTLYSKIGSTLFQSKVLLISLVSLSLTQVHYEVTDYSESGLGWRLSNMFYRIIRRPFKGRTGCKQDETNNSKLWFFRDCFPSLSSPIQENLYITSDKTSWSNNRSVDVGLPLLSDREFSTISIQGLSHLTYTFFFCHLVIPTPFYSFRS